MYCYKERQLSITLFPNTIKNRAPQMFAVGEFFFSVNEHQGMEVLGKFIELVT